MFIELSGHKVQIAHDGQQAIDEAELLHPEIVLLDIRMPDMDGFETCRRMRGKDWGGPITIVALTGWNQPADYARSRDAGFDMHWVKPIDLTALSQLLAGTPQITLPAENH
jgi:CheY-like chemotaxis protein